MASQRARADLWHHTRLHYHWFHHTLRPWVQLVSDAVICPRHNDMFCGCDTTWWFSGAQQVADRLEYEGRQLAVPAMTLHRDEIKDTDFIPLLLACCVEVGCDTTEPGALGTRLAAAIADWVKPGDAPGSIAVGFLLLPELAVEPVARQIPDDQLKAVAESLKDVHPKMDASLMRKADIVCRVCDLRHAQK
jgi:hypothetical protein